MARFSERLKILMKEKRVTLQRVADLCGVNRSTVYRWTKGDFEPDTEKLKEIADYFGVTVDYLLGNEETKNKTEPIDLMKILRDRENDELPHIDGVPIDEETAKILYYQLKAFKEKLLEEMKEKKREISA